MSPAHISDPSTSVLAMPFAFVGAGTTFFSTLGVERPQRYASLIEITHVG